MFAEQINIPPSLSLSTASTVKKLDLRSPAAFALRRSSCVRREESRTKEIYSLSIEKTFFLPALTQHQVRTTNKRRKKIFLDLSAASSRRLLRSYTLLIPALCSEHFVRHK
jgi:hypothetical protein